MMWWALGVLGVTALICANWCVSVNQERNAFFFAALIILVLYLFQ